MRGKTDMEQSQNTEITRLTRLFAAKRLSSQQKAEFCTQLSVMLQARISLHRALEIIVQQSTHGRLKEVTSSLYKEVSRGSSFAGALAKHPDDFDGLFIVTAEVGQESGRLAYVLENLSIHLEKMNALKRKIKQALAYPALVLCVAVGAVGFMLFFIVPTFAEMFKSFQVELPLSTRIVLHLSEMLNEYAWYGIGLIAVIAAIAFNASRNATLREKAQSILFRTPMIGPLVTKSLVARFCRTLGTLLQSQVSLIDALGITKRIFSDRKMQQEITTIIQHVKQGRALAEPLVASEVFPPMVAQMITVGEETSELDAMLSKVAEYYEKDIDVTIETLSTVLEPIIIVFLGMMVAAILISMYMPMFDLVNVVGGN